MVMPPLVLSCTAHCPAPPATSLPQPIWHLISWDCGKTTSDDISDISMQKCGWCWVDCGGQDVKICGQQCNVSLLSPLLCRSWPLICMTLVSPWSPLSDLLPWWCYCWWCWWPGGEQWFTLVPSCITLVSLCPPLICRLVTCTLNQPALVTSEEIETNLLLLKYYKMQYMIYLKLSQESL